MKKAQLRIGETIITLLIFFILLGMGLIFYVKFKSVSLEQKLQDQDQINTLNIAAQVKFFPEIQCTFLGTEISDCLDKYKIIAFSQLVELNDPNNRLNQYYSSLFPNTLVTVYVISSGDEQVYPLFGRNTTAESKGLDILSIPTAVYDPINDIYEFGYMKIEVFV